MPCIELFPLLYRCYILEFILNHGCHGQYLNLDHCYKLLQCINCVSTVINVQQIGASKIKCYKNNTVVQQGPITLIKLQYIFILMLPNISFSNECKKSMMMCK